MELIWMGAKPSFSIIRYRTQARKKPLTYKQSDFLLNLSFPVPSHPPYQLPHGPIKPHTRGWPRCQGLWHSRMKKIKGIKQAPRPRDWAEEAEKERGSVFKGVFSASKGSSPLWHLESPWTGPQTCGWHIDKSGRKEALHWSDSYWIKRTCCTSFGGLCVHWLSWGEA